VDEKKFNEMKRFELFPEDLIMSCSGTMGKIAIAPKNIKRGIINQALLKLSPSKKLFNMFLKLWMESSDFQKKIREYSLGAAIQNVASVKILKDIKIKLPSILEQKSIVQKLDLLSKEIKQLEQIYSQKLKDLEELKKSMLQKAFRGELTKE
jgi:type I restriction enzyme S subunit